MVQISRFFQARFPATLLRSTGLAIALIVLASPARSETLDLACATTDRDYNIRIQIDTDRRNITAVADFANWPVVITRANGDSRYIITTISDQFIKFTDKTAGSYEERAGNYGEGTLDRIAGTLHFENFSSGSTSRSDWACRRATKKF